MSLGFKIISKDVVKSASSITATSTAASTAIANCKNDRKTSFWKSTSLSAQTITITWTTAQLISAVALPYNNLIAGSTVNVKLYTNSGDGSPVLETGNVAIDHNFAAPYTYSTIGTDSFPFGGGNNFSTYFTEQSVKEIKLVINSSGNPDNHMALSRIIAGQHDDIASGVDYGSGVIFGDTSESLRREDGFLITEAGEQFITHRLMMEQLSDDDEGTLWKIIRKVGKSSPIYISAQDDETGEYKAIFQGYGVIENNHNLNAYAFNKNGAILQINSI